MSWAIQEYLANFRQVTFEWCKQVIPIKLPNFAVGMLVQVSLYEGNGPNEEAFTAKVESIREDQSHFFYRLYDKSREYREDRLSAYTLDAPRPTRKRTRAVGTSLDEESTLLECQRLQTALEKYRNRMQRVEADLLRVKDGYTQAMEAVETFKQRSRSEKRKLEAAELQVSVANFNATRLQHSMVQNLQREADAALEAQAKAIQADCQSKLHQVADQLDRMKQEKRETKRQLDEKTVENWRMASTITEIAKDAFDAGKLEGTEEASKRYVLWFDRAIPLLLR